VELIERDHTDPISVRWRLHALDMAQKLGFARTDVEPVPLAYHRERRRNAGRARWRVAAGRLTIAYEHPDGDDPLVARIVPKMHLVGPLEWHLFGVDAVSWTVAGFSG
jgi:hypothetical protein